MTNRSKVEADSAILGWVFLAVAWLGVLVALALCTGCAARVETGTAPAQQYCDTDTTPGAVEPGALTACTNVGGVCQCDGASIGGRCRAREICHVPEPQCRQLTTDVASVCPSSQFFVLLCYDAVPDPGGVDCVGGYGAPDSEPNVIWCCK